MRFVRLCVIAAALTVTAAIAPSTAAADTKRHIRYGEWTSTAQLRAGERNGTYVRKGVVRIGKPVGTTAYDDPYGAPTRRYDFARWVSPWKQAGFGLTELIASWNASTPRGTWIKVEVRGRTGSGRLGSWDTLGRWAAHDTRFHRMTLGAQSDDVARVNVDTLVTQAGVRLTSWRLRLTLYRAAGTNKTPRVAMIGAMASRVPAVDSVRRSDPGVARGVRLAVPRYSQMTHQGHYPQWDGGGRAWCSPTSTSMLLRYWGRGPTPKQYAWVDHDEGQPWVDYAARYVFDYEYDGAGNWPFNTAYAARFDTRGFVTRLRSLREAERFIKAGIPLAASIAFDSGELDNSPIGSTSGHVLVISGFTEKGNVVANDPAAATNKGVRRVYKRGQFENAWLPATGGVVYVVAPPGKALPRGATNW